MTSPPRDLDEVEVPRFIIPASLVISILAIGFLFWLIYGHSNTSGVEVSFLAPLNALLNASSAICLVTGYLAIRSGRWKLHRNLMMSALAFSSAFLVSYIIYHYFHGDTRFLGTGTIRGVYFAILISHIVLSVVALPAILVTVGLSLTRRFLMHKKWARWAFPIWTYVSVTGVLVYLLLRNYGGN